MWALEVAYALVDSAVYPSTQIGTLEVAGEECIPENEVDIDYLEAVYFLG